MFTFYRSYLIWCWNNCCKLIRLIMQCIRSECVNTIPIKHSRAVVALIALWFHFMGLIWFTFTMRFFFMLLKIPIKWFDSNIIISNDVVKTNISHYNSLNFDMKILWKVYPRKKLADVFRTWYIHYELWCCVFSHGIKLNWFDSRNNPVIICNLLNFV